MLEISSKRTYLVKRVIPVVLGIVLCLQVYFSILEGSGRPADFWVPSLLAVLFFGYTWLVAAGLVDEVFDCGHELLVRKGKIKQRVPLANIAEVSEGFVHVKPFGLFQVREVVIDVNLDTPLGRRFRFLPARHGLGGGYARVGVVNHLRLRAEKAMKESLAE